MLFPKINFSWWETLLMRAGFALLLYSFYPEPIPYQTTPFPNGIAHFIDVTWMAEPENFRAAFMVFAAGAVGYVVGALPFLSLSAMLFPLVAAATLINSQGAVSHHYQLLALVLTGQWAYSLYFLLRGRAPLRERLGVSNWLQSRLVAIALQIVAANYLLTGITKLLKTNGAWIWQSQYMPVQFEKIGLQKYYSSLVWDSPSLGSELSQLCLEHPWLCFVLYAPGLLLELLTPLILLGRGWSFFTGVCVVLMHRLIAITMSLQFTQHEWVVAIFAINPPYWIGRFVFKAPERKPDLESAPGRPVISWANAAALKWFLASIVIGLLLKENFPVSHWPMYASFSPRATVVFVENAAAGPIACRDFGGLSGARMKRIYERFYKAEKKPGGELPKAAADLLRKQRAGEKCLVYLRALAKPGVLDKTESLTLVELTVRMEKGARRTLRHEPLRLATVASRL